MVFNEKIKEKGLQKKWIAKQLSISPTSLSFYLTGTRPIPVNIENRLKEILR